MEYFAEFIESEISNNIIKGEKMGNIFSRKKLLGISLIIFLTLGTDLSAAYALGDQLDQPQDRYPSLPIENLPRTAVNNILTGVSQEEQIDIQYEKFREYYYSNDDYSRLGLDSGDSISESKLNNKEILDISKVNEIALAQPSGIEEQNITKSTETVTIPGLLQAVTHIINGSSSGKVFLDSTLDDYTIQANRLVDYLVRSGSPQRNGHFGMVVFVSDYGSRSIDKLRENNVWLQVYSRLETWLTETSDYYVMLVNEFGSTDNIMNILAAAEINPSVKSIGLTVVSHGVSSVYGHGLLLHRNNEPKKMSVLDGRYFQESLDKTGVKSISKLIHTNLHSCYLIDEYKQYDQKSVMGFFERQNYAQIITGYSGLTYLNTRFVLSLENLLSAGTYILPSVTTTTPVVLTSENNTIVHGRADYIETLKYELTIKDGDLPTRYDTNFGEDDTLFVSDINRSPATGEATYYDLDVYEHLGVTPPSFFPTEGTPYSFEGHKIGTWMTINANDDEYFYFAKGAYDGYIDEFGEGYPTSSSSLSSTKWSTSGVTSENGFAYLSLSASIEELGVASRPLSSSFTIIFKLGDEDQNSNGQIVIGIKGDKLSDSLVPSGYTTIREFGIRIDDYNDRINLVHQDGTILFEENVPFISNRIYQLTISFKSGVGFLSITTPEDPDFYHEITSTGYADMINPRLFATSFLRKAYLDFYQAKPELSVTSNVPQFTSIYEDADLSFIHLSGSGGTLNELTDVITGSQSVRAGSTTNPDWYQTSAYFDDVERYMGFAMKASTSTTLARIQFKVDSNVYSIEPSTTTNLNDLVILKDNQWHYYAIDLHNMFGITGTIQEISFQQIGGVVLIDSVYLSSSLSSLAVLEKNSIDTLSESLEMDENINSPLFAHYSLDTTLEDSSTNNYDASYISGSGSGYIDDFNDGVIAPEWTENPNTGITWYENSGKIGTAVTGGGSSWTAATLDKTIGDISSVDVDYNYYFPSGKMGIIQFVGRDVNGAVTFVVQLKDAWSGSTKRMYIDGRVNGVVVSSWTTDISGYDTGSGHILVDFVSASDLHIVFDYPSGQKVLDVSGVSQTSKIQLYGYYHGSYYSTSMVNEFDNYVETSSSTPLSYESGVYGQAAMFSGDNSYLELNTAAITSQITMAAWVKVNSYPTTSSEGIFTQRYSSNYHSRGLYANFDGTIGAFSRDSSNTWKSVNFGSFSTGTWNHIVLVQDENIIYAYTNGIFTTSLDMGSNNGASMLGYFNLGKYTDSELYFDGSLDDVKLYASAISADEVQLLYENDNQLVHHYTFDGDFTDIVGSNDGVEVGTPSYESGLDGSAMSAEANGYATISPIIFDKNKECTIAWWQKVTGWSFDAHGVPSWGGDYAAVLGDGTTDSSIDLQKTASGTRIIMQDDGGVYYSSQYVDYSKNEWGHFAIEFTASSVKFFYNGEFIGQSATGLSNDLTVNKIARAYGNTILDGKLDDLKIYGDSLSDNEVRSLYMSYTTPQSFAIINNALDTSDNPSYSISTTIRNRKSTGSKINEYYVTIGGTNYGIKLVNGDWKELDGTSINTEISHQADDSYTINFDLNEGSTRILDIYLTKGNITTLVSTYTSVSSGSAVPHVSTQDGYYVSSYISGSANLGSNLYADNAAYGAITQGAFALKFTRKSEVKTVDLGYIIERYEEKFGYTNPEDSFSRFLRDVSGYMACAGINSDPSVPCNPLYYNMWGTDINDVGSFAQQMYDYRQEVDVNDIADWSTRWVNYAMKETKEGTNNGASVLRPHEFDGTGGDVYNYYYNDDSVDPDYDVTVNVDGLSGDQFRLYHVVDDVNTLVTVPGTITIDSSLNEYFYVQFLHGADTSKFRLSFTPVNEDQDIAYHHDYGSSPIMRSYATDLDGATEQAMKLEVSQAIYRVDEYGNYEHPSYIPLVFEDNKYWLTQMLAIGGLPRVGDSFSSTIDASTYFKDPNVGGEKLVSDTVYFSTAASTETQYNYELTESVSNLFDLVDNTNYMVSFALETRYKSDITVEITVTMDTDIAVYLENEDSYLIGTPTLNVGADGAYKRYSFTIDESTSIQSLLVKVQAKETMYTYQILESTWHDYPHCWDGTEMYPAPDPAICDLFGDEYRAGYYTSQWVYYNAYKQPSLEINLPGFNGYSVTMETVDDVEEVIRHSLSGTNIANIVLGDQFQANILNERQDASIPYTARASMDAAASENPTKDRIFDVTLLLEKIVEDFNNLKSNVRAKIYEMLSFDEQFLGMTFRSDALADLVWGLVDKYGFGTIEKIINWFNEEAQQERLADLILSDVGLQEELNLNTPDNLQYDENAGLNYLAVAKVGIMVFADYIHDTYIASSSVINGIWNSISALNGKTLVNIVGDIWDAGTTLMNNIKSGVSNLVEKVKVGLEYIADAVLSFIYQSMASMIGGMVSSLGYLANVLFGTGFDFSVSNGVNYITSNGKTTTISVSSFSDGIEFIVNQDKFVLSNLFSGMQVQKETLSPNVALDAGILAGIMTVHMGVELVAAWRILENFNGKIGSDLPIMVMAILLGEFIAFTGEMAFINSIKDDYLDPIHNGEYEDEFSNIVNAVYLHHMTKFFGHLLAMIEFTTFNPVEKSNGYFRDGVGTFSVDLNLIDLFKPAITAIVKVLSWTELVFDLIDGGITLLKGTDLWPLGAFQLVDVGFSYLETVIFNKYENKPAAKIGIIIFGLLSFANLIISILYSSIYPDYVDLSAIIPSF